MTLLGLALRNLHRNRLRSALTVLATAAGVLTFVLVQTVLSSWQIAAEHSAQDRIMTRHKVSFYLSLPKTYIESLRRMSGVKAATFATWFGGKAASDPKATFVSLAVDERTYLQVYSELELPADQLARWHEDRQGAIVGDLTAKALNLHVGDRVTLTGTLYPGDWQFNVDGIFHSTRHSTEGSWFLFHWDLINQSPGNKNPDQIGWMVSQVSDVSQGPGVTAAIDRTLSLGGVPTASMSERAMNISFLAGTSVILETLRAISLIILALLMLVVASSIALSVRERVHEYGVMRAMGFNRNRVTMCVVEEGLALGLFGAVLGLGLSVPIIQRILGGYIEANMSGLLPYFRITPSTAVLALLSPVVLSFVASLVPAWWVSHLLIADSLRRAE